MPAPILPTSQIHLPEHEKYKNALTLAARPLGTDASTKPQSRKFEEICVEFDFPRPREQKPGEKILDENLPNIFVYTIEEDYLALARSLAQTKKM